MNQSIVADGDGAPQQPIGRMEDLNKSIVGGDGLTIATMEDLDMSVIKEAKWAQDMWAKLCQSSQKAFLNWCKIVLELGLDKENIESWSNVFVTQVEGTLCAMVADVNDVNTRTVEKIEEMLVELENLCKALHLPMPVFGTQRLRLYEEQNQLYSKIKEYKAIMEIRKSELNALRAKQMSLCKSLGKEPHQAYTYTHLPTAAELESFKEHIDQLEAEKFDREEKFFKLKEEIEDMVQELKYKPSTDFERLVLENGHFHVTRNNMESLDWFHKHLKEILKSTEEEISNLRSRIEDLWRMLEIDIMDQDEFRNRYTGKSLETLEAMRVEVKRCEEIRRANIRRFIEKLRRELEEVWDSCHCSERDKAEFSWYKSDVYTEDLLYFHEMELQTWRAYFDKNAKLLGAIEKHTKLWQRVIELEEKATGVNRYQNRGGQLLQEEKERNKLSKQIPKLEFEMQEMANEFEYANNKPFLTRGLTIEEYINHLHEERENQRKIKLSARKLQRENTMLTPAKSAMSLFPSTSTALTPNTLMSSTKRKILVTPNNESKKPRMLATPMSGVRQLRTPSAVRTKTPLKPQIKAPQIKVTSSTVASVRQKHEKRRSSEKKKRLIKARRLSKRLEKNLENAETDTTNTTYSEFQDNLSSNDRLRSTILPQNIVDGPTSSSPRRTPRAPRNTPRNTPNRIPGRLTAKSPGFGVLLF